MAGIGTMDMATVGVDMARIGRMGMAGIGRMDMATIGRMDVAAIGIMGMVAIGLRRPSPDPRLPINTVYYMRWLEKI